MKRKGNLYKDIYNIDNIRMVFHEITRNTRNKRKVEKYKEFKCINICRIYNILKEKRYIPGEENHFTIFERKTRMIVSQNMDDKLVNHLVSRFILYPAILPCLIDQNVASRAGKGTSEGIKFRMMYEKICRSKYQKFYILKCDVHKFFKSMDKDILKQKLAKKIKDSDALNILSVIIDSDDDGLSIGKMTSQVLAIFYLNDLDHFIKEKLKIKYYVRYQDDFLLYHESKEYLKYCFKQIEDFLAMEKLKLNPKSRIYKSTDNFIFLRKR